MMAITKLRERKSAPEEVNAYFELARQFKQHFCIEGCGPHFVGVWDTVRMLRESKDAGLLVEPARVDLILGRSGGGYVLADAKADMHESLTPAWWVAEFIPKRHYDWKRKEEERRMNRFRRRTIPPGSLVHQSASERGDAYRGLLPPDAIVVS